MSDEGLTQLLQVGAAPVLRCRRLVLRVTAGPDAGRELGSSAERISVGTLERNDLQLTDPSVSRFHLELVRTREGYRLRDLGSSNGTYVGNVRVIEAVIDRDTAVQLGATTLALIFGRDRDDIALHPEPRFGELCGESACMRALFAQLARLAATNATVLIVGPSGTGKELAARALHEHGVRRGRPFVVVDCSSIPGELAESELFGHERGAFTGASVERRGAFESADGGTLSLDEVGELPLALQPKLLRALEARQIKRVGADAARPVDVRVIATTNRDLRQAVNRGQFREDLFYRLGVAIVRMPPLRDHIEDLPLLLQTLWAQALVDLGVAPRPFPRLNSEVLRELSSLPWEGNVRELRNFVEHSLALTEDIDLELLPGREAATPGQRPEIRFDLPYVEAKTAWQDYFEREYVRQRLAHAGGSVSRLAREAAMDRTNAIKLLRKHGLR